jgi:NAD(P)-dependent dehydrogenase (short-subunit alcohol dehydrogenase family)
MPAQELPGTTALVNGVSHGFGRAIIIALAKHGIWCHHGQLG